jgi:uncharacterized membrane protein
MVVEPGAVPRWAAVARLPLQVPLVLWALQVARSAAADRDAPRPLPGAAG